MPTRFRAPSENRSFLAEPPRSDWPECVAANRQKSLAANRLAEIRNQLRAELVPLLLAENPSASADAILSLKQACHDQRPIIVTGHQPELYHPGVWVKNFATQALAQQVGGIGLHLIVDNDTVKSTALRLPIWTGDDPTSVRIAALPFDRPDMEMPYELRRIEDPDCFREFPHRVAELTANWGYEPILHRIWPKQVATRNQTLSRCFIQLRRVCEQEWGCVNWELPVSRLAKTGAFQRFVQSILDDLPRFQKQYNFAVLDYRQRHRIRSRHHPVPLLETDEAPFWGSTESGRRSRFFRSESFSLDAVRPRALTLTLFARLFLGDFFIHGIGGGKYDEVTDAIIRNYYRLEPPRFAVLSATLFLPLPYFPLPEPDSRWLARRHRDLFWNPQRYVDNAEASKAEKQRLIASEPQDHLGRRRWFQQLRAATEGLRTLVKDQLQAMESAELLAKQREWAVKLQQRRDYSWVLYPDKELRPFLQSFLNM